MFDTIEVDMRTAEWIHIVAFSWFVLLAWLRWLPGRRRAKVTGIGVVGLGTTFAGAFSTTAVRDWLPAGLMLLVYWQAGEFFLRVDLGLQHRLERIDKRFVAPMMRWISRRRARGWIAAFLELSYLLCYPMIPMSIGALYLLGLERHADFFWMVVLVSTYLSYGALPFLQTAPPRVLKEPWLEPLAANPIRTFNLWILRHASVHANTFPSAHVAASAAAALVLTTVAPWPVGLLFVTIAAGIAMGTFAGRYHFGSDAVAGIVVATTVFLFTR